MTATVTADVTEEITRVVLGATYGAWGFHNEPSLMNSLMEVVEDVEKREIDESYGATASPAAEEVREILWNRYSGGGVSAIATCNLFYALGRQDELGWVRAEAGNYSDYAYERFFRKVIVPAMDEATLVARGFNTPSI